MNEKSKKIIRAYRGEKNENGQCPWWLMRQAGRYLPEYRELRAQAGGFLELVYDPEKASEITLQPIRRFGMNGAILFSDILVIPQALGQKLWFETGEGPRLDRPFDFEKLDVSKIDETLSPVYETVKRVSSKLEMEGFDETALLGFCGGPWTVACYMIEGGSSKNGFAAVKDFMAAEPLAFSALLGCVTNASIHYLCRQIEAGCAAVQIFESWAGLLEGPVFASCVIEPTAKIVKAVKEKYPDIPVIGFPRAAKPGSIKDYAAGTQVNCVGLDYETPLDLAAALQKDGFCVQGNLDPEILLKGGEEMKLQTENILKVLSSGPFVFNLGHGVIKETPPEHVAALAKIIESYKF